MNNVNKKIKLLLLCSLAINILLIGYIVFSKKTIIKKFITNFSEKESVATDKQLQKMNNVFIPSFVDTCNNNSGDKYKVLILGNSLSYHGVAKNIGWHYISGMAASSMSKDYVHLLFKKIENRLQNKKICIRISQFATFERNLESFQQKALDSLIVYRPDVIIFQLGENVRIQNQQDKLLFEEKYIELINSFRTNGNPLTICTTPFFPSLPKNEIIAKVALSTGSFLVDLSHLPLLDSLNYAKYDIDYIGNKTVWKVDGIGIHPGDYRMENIAQQLFITINASIPD
jgi:hypothetical protein